MVSRVLPAFLERLLLSRTPAPGQGPGLDGTWVPGPCMGIPGALMSLAVPGQAPRPQYRGCQAPLEATVVGTQSVTGSDARTSV